MIPVICKYCNFNFKYCKNVNLRLKHYNVILCQGKIIFSTMFIALYPKVINNIIKNFRSFYSQKKPMTYGIAW